MQNRIHTLFNPYNGVNMLYLDRIKSLIGIVFMDEAKRINRLKVVLVEQGISHKQFAHIVKKTPNTITRICNNQQLPSLVFLREMAIALNIGICDLLVPIVISK